MEPATATRRAIGVVRVSQVAGRSGESFASPAEQRDRISAACERDGLALVETIEELDVSGGTPLERRDGMRRAVEAVEAGDAAVIVVAYFDRLVRSLAVQGELVERVERAGGQVLAVDTGAVTNGSAGQWMQATTLGMMAEYQRRTAAERSGEAQARAVARGVCPFPSIPPGYRRVGKWQRREGALEPDPAVVPIVLRAFELRAAGATLAVVRDHLVANGIGRSYHGVGHLLESRIYLGEIHFGDLVNLEAHEAIVPRELWQAVQRVKVPRGRRAKSDRLLARLGVLRCGSCDARMVVASSNNGRYYSYRCPPHGNCPRHVSIGAELVEDLVVDQVREWLRDVEGRASVEADARQAAADLERAQQELDVALRAFTASGVQDESSAVERLAELRQAREDAEDHLGRLGGLRSVVTINAADDWDRLSLDARRALIRATVERVVVAPGGRGARRITVEPFGE